MSSAYLASLHREVATTLPVPELIEQWRAKHMVWRVYPLCELKAIFGVNHVDLIAALYRLGWQRVKVQRHNQISQGWVPPLEWLPD